MHKCNSTERLAPCGSLWGTEILAVAVHARWLDGTCAGGGSPTRQIATHQWPSTTPAKKVCASKARAALLCSTANALCPSLACAGFAAAAGRGAAAGDASLLSGLQVAVGCLLAPADRTENALRCAGMSAGLLAGFLGPSVGAAAA